MHIREEDWHTQISLNELATSEGNSKPKDSEGAKVETSTMLTEVEKPRKDKRHH